MTLSGTSPAETAETAVEMYRAPPSRGADDLSPEDCPYCVLCLDHHERVLLYGSGADADPPVDAVSETEPVHDVAECSCPVFALCAACVAAVAADDRRQHEVDLRILTRAVRALIERNGYCVVCERYAPFHLIDCVMIRARPIATTDGATGDPRNLEKEHEHADEEDPHDPRES